MSFLSPPNFLSVRNACHTQKQPKAIGWAGVLFTATAIDPSSILPHSEVGGFADPLLGPGGEEDDASDDDDLAPHPGAAAAPEAPAAEGGGAGLMEAFRRRRPEDDNKAQGRAPEVRDPMSELRSRYDCPNYYLR